MASVINIQPYTTCVNTHPISVEIPAAAQIRSYLLRSGSHYCPLWCPYRRLRPLAVFAYPRFQPFLDQAMVSLVGDPVLDETHRPFVTHVVEDSPHPRSSSLPSVRSSRSTHPMPPETSGDPCGLRPGRNP